MNTNEETLRRLAEQVLVDRLQRFVVVEVTEKGRLVWEPTGEPTAAELQWEALRAQFA